MTVRRHAETILVHGRAISFLAAGNAGPDVLLLHGFGSDRTSFLLNQAEIASFASTLALDLPGHGASSPNVGDGSIGFFRDTVVAFLEARRMGPVDMVGHSLGGAIAIEIAHRRPDLVRSLFLISPAGIGRALDPSFLADFTEMGTAEEAEQVLRRLVARPRLISRQMAAGVLGQLSKPGVREAMRKLAFHLHVARPSLIDAVTAVGAMDIPKSLVWGSADLINPIDRAYATKLHADTHILEGVGHLPHVENPAKVNELIRLSLMKERTPQARPLSETHG
jgi:pimeloyl-ACP methyl ester carboxylesterase